VQVAEKRLEETTIQELPRATAAGRLSRVTSLERRPKGSLNKTSSECQEMLLDRYEEILLKLIERAKEGDRGQ
jgi:histone H3/H4